MSDILSYTGKLVDFKMEYTKTGQPYVEITLDEMPFRYFQGSLDHKVETLEGIKAFKGSALTVRYTERLVEGRQYPYRNIESFPVLMKPAIDQGMGSQREQGKDGPKPPAAPAGPAAERPAVRGPVGPSGKIREEPPAPPVGEMIISDLEQDPEVRLYSHCIRLSLVAWLPQFEEWKNEGLQPSPDFLMGRIGETASSFYITKVKERR